MKKFNWFIFTFLAFALFSCEDNEAVLDEIPPTITIISPTSQMEFYPDDEILLKAIVTDNLGLEEVIVSITPPSGATQVVLTEDVDDFLNDNTKAEIEKVITLSTATPAAGSYIITVTAVDERDNEVIQAITINVLEADDVAPVVVVTTPEENSAFALGDEVGITANVEEERMLREVRVFLGPDGVEPLFTETFTEGFEEGVPFAIDETFIIPNNAPVGNYILTFEAEDVAGNVVPFEVPFTVSEAAAGSE